MSYSSIQPDFPASFRHPVQLRAEVECTQAKWLSCCQLLPLLHSRSIELVSICHNSCSGLLCIVSEELAATVQHNACASCGLLVSPQPCCCRTAASRSLYKASEEGRDEFGCPAWPACLLWRLARQFKAFSGATHAQCPWSCPCFVAGRLPLQAARHRRGFALLWSWPCSGCGPPGVQATWLCHQVGCSAHVAVLIISHEVHAISFRP